MALSPREPSRPVLDATHVRQGRWGRHVFWVLVFGTLLAALALFAAWTWRAGDLAATEPTHFQQQKTAKSFDLPEPPPPNPQQPDPTKW